MVRAQHVDSHVHQRSFACICCCHSHPLWLPWLAGEGEARSVEGQVQQLLLDAQDPDKLCRMYAGWAAWL